MLLPMFLKWSEKVNATLVIDEVRLRNAKWVELVAVSGVPDVNAVARDFFSPKGKNQQIQFNPGKTTELYLEMEYSKYHDINEALQNP